jgi:hypothetical protein
MEKRGLFNEKPIQKNYSMTFWYGVVEVIELRLISTYFAREMN